MYTLGNWNTIFWEIEITFPVFPSLLHVKNCFPTLFIDKILVFVKYYNTGKFSWGKCPNLHSLPHHGWEGAKKICNFSRSRTTNLALSSVVSTSNTTVQTKLTNVNYVYGYFSVTHVWPHLQLFLTLTSERKLKKFEDVNEKMDSSFYEKTPSMIISYHVQIFC